MAENKQYTNDSNDFIASLLSQGYLKEDIERKFITGGVQVTYPVIGDDGKPHLAKIKFKSPKNK